MKLKGICTSCRINQSVMFCLAVAEPIITTLSSPLIVDLYSGSTLTLSCNGNHVIFVDAVSVLITLSSIATVFLCIKNILRLVPKINSEIETKIGPAFLLTFALNVIFTSFFISAITGNEPRDEMDDESCWYGFMKKTSIAVGAKSFVPQILICATLFIIATILCYNRRNSNVDKQPYENQSLAVGIYLPILSVFFFQLICFLLRFSFTICTCGWYTLLSRRMGGTLQMCFIKSILMMSLYLFAFIYNRRKYKDYRMLYP